MTDKVQKIKEFLIGMAGAACCDAKTKKNIEKNILPFVDSLQEEPTGNPFDSTHAEFKTAVESLGISQEEHDRIVDECIYGKEPELVDANDLPKEEPVSDIDFEQELYKAFGQVKDFTLGMRIAKWFYDMGKNSQEPVSEPNKELAETYLAVFDKKFPILPSLKGKQLADYKNFLNKCQQIFGLKEWGIRPIQSKLFEKLSLLWAAWGAEHLQGVGRQDEKEQDIPVSDGLEEAMQHSAPDNIGIDDLLLWRNGFITGAKWQEDKDKQTLNEEGVVVLPKEEPVCKDLEKVSDKYSEDIESDYSNDMFDRGDIMKAFEAGANWQREKDESTTEDLGKYINELSKQFPEVSFAKLSRIAIRVAKWQKANLWKHADGDDLPEIDREVIVLVKYSTQRNIYDEEYPTYGVGFGHRPNPNGWDGKSVTTGNVEHYTPKTYDKGGWNIPNIVYWLDVKLPKEIEL